MADTTVLPSFDWVSAGASIILKLTPILISLAQGTQAPDMGPEVAWRDFGVQMDKDAYRKYYYALGFVDSGDRSAYAYTTQIMLSPQMILYMYSLGGNSFLSRLGNTNVTYGQDFLTPFKEYLQTGNPKKLNDLYAWLLTGANFGSQNFLSITSGNLQNAYLGSNDVVSSSLQTVASGLGISSNMLIFIIIAIVFFLYMDKK